MKKKIVYMLAFICCMSFFSAAKQAEKNYNKDTACEKKDCKHPLSKEPASENETDGPTLNFFPGIF